MYVRNSNVNEIMIEKVQIGISESGGNFTDETIIRAIIGISRPIKVRRQPPIDVDDLVTILSISNLVFLHSAHKYIGQYNVTVLEDDPLP
jgi:hypothetical protein